MFTTIVGNVEVPKQDQISDTHLRTDTPLGNEYKIMFWQFWFGSLFDISTCLLHNNFFFNCCSLLSPYKSHLSHYTDHDLEGPLKCENH